VSEHPCTLSLRQEVPRWAGWKWVKIPAKMDFQTFLQVASTYQGYLQKYWVHFGEGPGVWGEGRFWTPFGRETTNN